jgi:hypothetical protein
MKLSLVRTLQEATRHALGMEISDLFEFERRTEDGIRRSKTGSTMQPWQVK